MAGPVTTRGFLPGQIIDRFPPPLFQPSYNGPTEVRPVCSPINPYVAAPALGNGFALPWYRPPMPAPTEYVMRAAIPHMNRQPTMLNPAATPYYPVQYANVKPFVKKEFPQPHFSNNSAGKQNVANPRGRDPWMTSEIFAEIKKKKSLQTKAQSEKSTEAWNSFKVQRNKVSLMLKQAKEQWEVDNGQYSKYYCDTCDKSFSCEPELKCHFTEHVVCKIDGCTFEAHPKIVNSHKKMQHDTGFAKKIVNGSCPSEIDKWIKERKRNFPTANRIAEKRAEQNEMEARGEVIKQKEFGKNRKFGKRGERNETSDSGKKKRTRRPKPKNKEENAVSQSNENDESPAKSEDQSENVEEKKGKLKKFAGFKRKTQKKKNSEDSSLKDAAVQTLPKSEDEATLDESVEPDCNLLPSPIRKIWLANQNVALPPINDLKILDTVKEDEIESELLDIQYYNKTLGSDILGAGDTSFTDDSEMKLGFSPGRFMSPQCTNVADNQITRESCSVETEEFVKKEELEQGDCSFIDDTSSPIAVAKMEVSTLVEKQELEEGEIASSDEDSSIEKPDKSSTKEISPFSVNIGGALGSLMSAYDDTTSEADDTCDNSPRKGQETSMDVQVNGTGTESTAKATKVIKRKMKEPTIPVNKKQHSLLEKLLAPEIRHERNVIMQCAHHVVKTKFPET